MSVQSEKAENKQKEAKIEKLTDRLRKMSSDPKNKPKRSKTLTVNMTKEEKELLAAEKEYFKKNKRKKWDYMDPEIHKRYKGGMIKGYKHGGSVKAGRLAKRGYGAAKK